MLNSFLKLRSYILTLSAISTADPFDHEYVSSREFSCISCLNVLDRCDRPLTLLRAIHAHMTKKRSSSPRTNANPVNDSGSNNSPSILLLVVVLPLLPYVEDVPEELEKKSLQELSQEHLGGVHSEVKALTNTSAAHERVIGALERATIETDEGSFERCVNRFVSTVLTPLKFTVLSVSRVPYLSQGDVQQSLYTLDDAVFVLRVNS